MGSEPTTLEAPKKTSPVAKFFLVALSVFVVLVFLIGLAGNPDKPRTGNASNPTLSPVQLKQLAEQIPYAELARNPTQYVGRLIYFRGKVIQALERGQDVTFRISVTQGASGRTFSSSPITAAIRVSLAFWKTTSSIFGEGTAASSLMSRSSARRSRFHPWQLILLNSTIRAPSWEIRTHYDNHV
jgi:hypothetical protein